MFTKKATFCLLTMLSLNVIAGDANNTTTAKHIDSQLKNCIASAPAGVVKTLECLAENTELWNIETNARIEQLKTGQNDEKNIALEKAQSAWVAYRDAQFRYFEKDIASEPTSQKIIDFSEQELALVKKRALEL